MGLVWMFAVYCVYTIYGIYALERIQLMNTRPAEDTGSCGFSLVNDPGYVIPNSSISASDMFDSGHCHRVNARDVSNLGPDAWCSEFMGVGTSWLQYDFGALRRVTGIRAGARTNMNQWVSAYKINYYNLETGDWSTVQDDSFEDIVFTGSSQMGDIVNATLPAPGIRTNKIRWFPTACNSRCAGRLDVIGC